MRPPERPGMRFDAATVTAAVAITTDTVATARVGLLSVGGRGAALSTDSATAAAWTAAANLP